MGALDPLEVRHGLATDDNFDIEKMLDDVQERNLLAGWENAETGQNDIDEQVKTQYNKYTIV